MDEPLVSVIVPTYNEEENIGWLMDDLLSLSYENLEIVVVDDGSTDGTWEALEKYDVRKILKEENEGFASAVNRGVEEAEGEFNWQVNADIRVRDRGIIQKFLKEFEEDTVAVWGAVGVENNEKFFPSMMSAAKKLNEDYLYGSANVMFRTEFSKANPYYEDDKITSPDFEMREKIEEKKDEDKYAENIFVKASYPEGFVDNVKQRYRYSKSHINLMKRDFDRNKLVPIVRDWITAGGVLCLPFLVRKLWLILLVLTLGYFSYRARVYDKNKFGVLSVLAELFFVFVRSFGYLKEMMWL